MLLEQSEERIKQLNTLISFFKEQMKMNQSNQLIPSNSPIQCLIIPGTDQVKDLAQQLQENGFDVRPILSPTVPKGKERLRICLHAFNTEIDIGRLTNAIGRYLQTVNS
jgi:8-amino-7-oxononanoate synthase